MISYLLAASVAAAPAPAADAQPAAAPLPLAGTSTYPQLPISPALQADIDRHIRSGRPGPAQLRRGFIADDDYPAAAIRDEAQGTVVMRYVIGTNGRVRSCLVVESSGNAVLDHASCQLVQSRFAFLPAIGADGRPTEETRTQSIAWRMPSDPPPPPPPIGPDVPQSEIGRVMLDDYPPAAMRAGVEGIVVVGFVISTLGRPESCEVIQSSGNADLDSASCAMVTNRFRFRPAIGPDGRATTETRTQRIVWQLP
jgi:TonB family protein